MKAKPHEEEEGEEEEEEEEEGSSISIESSWAHEFHYLIDIPVSTLWVCWNRSSTASLEGKRSVEGQSNWNQMGKWYVGVDVSIDSYWDCNFNYPMSVHQGSAGISRLLHPLKLKAKDWNQLRVKICLSTRWCNWLIFFLDHCISTCLSVHCSACQSVSPSVSPSITHKKNTQKTG